MEKSTFEVTKLVASEGHILTDGKTYGREIFFASGNLSDWREITAAEYEEIMAAEAAKTEAESEAV